MSDVSGSELPSIEVPRRDEPLEGWEGINFASIPSFGKENLHEEDFSYDDSEQWTDDIVSWPHETSSLQSPKYIPRLNSTLVNESNAKEIYQVSQPVDLSTISDVESCMFPTLSSDEESSATNDTDSSLQESPDPCSSGKPRDSKPISRDAIPPIHQPDAGPLWFKKKLVRKWCSLTVEDTTTKTTFDGNDSPSMDSNSTPNTSSLSPHQCGIDESRNDSRTNINLSKKSVTFGSTYSREISPRKEKIHKEHRHRKSPRQCGDVSGNVITDSWHKIKTVNPRNIPLEHNCPPCIIERLDDVLDDPVFSFPTQLLSSQPDDVEGIGIYHLQLYSLQTRLYLHPMNRVCNIFVYCCD